MSLRCEELGWRLCAMNDPAQRRGIWYRYDNFSDLKVLELCGGREGDDHYVKLELGQSITFEVIRQLMYTLSTAEWVLGQNPEFTGKVENQCG